MAAQVDLRIALLPWGDVIEDFLDPIGLSLEDLRDHMTGGWAFGYIDSLQRVGVETELVCFSAKTTRLRRWQHGPTGASLTILPTTLPYKMLRRRLVDPYAWTDDEAIGNVRRRSRPLALFARHAAPYCATPVARLARYLYGRRHSALLCQEYEYPRFDVCTALGALLRLPVFATFQGGDYQLTMLEPKLRPLALRACNGVIVGSSAEVTRLESRYELEPAKIARIFNPFDVAAWPVGSNRRLRHELGIPQEARVVAWHGRVELHRKGLDVLCHAWQLLTDAHSDLGLRLLLIGTGVDAAELHRRIEGIPLRDVHWVDDYIVDRALIQSYLSAADVYVFPSRHEGFPVAPIEAMASGLPVVAADAPGVLDIIKDGEVSGGVVVAREDGPALAAALTGLLVDDDRRRELGRRARQRAEAAFAPESVGRQLKDFLLARGAALTAQPNDGLASGGSRDDFR